MIRRIITRCSRCEHAFYQSEGGFHDCSAHAHVRPVEAVQVDLRTAEPRTVDRIIGHFLGGIWQPESARASFWMWPAIEPGERAFPKYSMDVPHYSTEWAVGGPLFEKYGVASRQHSSGRWYAMALGDAGDGTTTDWVGVTPRNIDPNIARLHQNVERVQRFQADSRLLAEARCLAAQFIGCHEVAVPKEFTK